MSDKLPMTKEGHTALKEELYKLKKFDRRKVIQAISDARELGDLSDNAEYSAAKELQGHIEGRIAAVGDKLARAQVIDTSTLSNERVVFGVTIKIVNIDTDEEKTLRIVGVDEANLEKGTISITSPIARGLIGKNVGDIAKVNTPAGIKEFEVEDIYFE